MSSPSNRNSAPPSSKPKPAGYTSSPPVAKKFPNTAYTSKKPPPPGYQDQYERYATNTDGQVYAVLI